MYQLVTVVPSPFYGLSWFFQRRAGMIYKNRDDKGEENLWKKTAEKNKKKVVAEYGDWVYSTPQYYYDAHGCWLGLKNASVKVTYPKDYRGLCIGIGGSTALQDTANDTKFWNGKAAFGKTSYYSKKDKSVAHFMRVTK